MDPVFTVFELTTAIKKQLETRFSSISVQGEVTNFKEQTSGHLYFTLKDAQSQISAVLFKGSTRNLSRLPRSGDLVIVKGEISVYAPRGNYQLIIRELQFSGVGDLLLKLHELKLKLQEKGWFDQEHKKPIPKIPKIIGVVTSPTGAVIQDILQVLNRRFSGFHLILNPVKVQGEGSAFEIAEAIRQFNKHALVDVIIVGRGGGSLEDLWAFNEEIVAEAIYNSTIPVISAVGHETDFSLSDLVADKRASTPSVAAEMVIAEKEVLLKQLSQIKARLRQTYSQILEVLKQRLKGLTRHPILSTPYGILGTLAQKVDDMQDEITHSLKIQIQNRHLLLSSLSRQCHALSPQTQIQGLRSRLVQIAHQIRRAAIVEPRKVLLMGLSKQLQMVSPELKVIALRKNLSQLIAHLTAIDPKNLLEKGFCILFDENDNSVIFSKSELANNQNIRIRLSDGTVKAKTYDI